MKATARPPWRLAWASLGASHTLSTGAADYALRSALIDGAPWFVAADVCRALGKGVYGGPTQGLPAHQKRTLTRTQDRAEFFGMAPKLVLVSEGGLYALIMRSDKEAARPFQAWVTDEVLPSIRKTGSYALADHGRTEMPIPAEFMAVIREAMQAQAQLGERVAGQFNLDREPRHGPRPGLKPANLGGHQKVPTNTCNCMGYAHFANYHAASEIPARQNARHGGLSGLPK